jgi:hypothetical protein
MANALALNTTSNYNSVAIAFISYCLYFERTPILPASDATIAGWLTVSSLTCSAASLRVYLSGVRFLHVSNGFPWPEMSERSSLFLCYRGIKRLCGRPSKPKLPITLELLLKIYHKLNFDDHDTLMWWAAALVAFYGFLRKDNVTVKKASAFNVRANLCRGDFRLEEGSWTSPPSDSVAWLKIRHSKVNQANTKEHLIPLMPIEGSPLCPVLALRKAFGASPCGEEEAAFMMTKDGVKVPMEHAYFVSSLKSALEAIGVNPDDYSGHSFRSGGCTLAFTLPGLAERHELIRWLGDWATSIYLDYNRLSVESKKLLPSALAEYARSLGTHIS